MAIDSIYNLGDDSLSTEWQVVIPTFPGVLDLANIPFRVTELTLPGYSVDTYIIDYKTQKFTKPKAKITTPTSFSFTFRIDKYWQVYESFEAWLNYIGNNDTGVMTPDMALPGGSSLIRIPIDVIPIDSAGTVTKKGWTFVNSYIKSLDGVTFNQTGEVLTAKAEFEYLKKIMRT